MAPWDNIGKMTAKQKQQIKKKLSFEAWRDRAFSVIIPGVLVYLLITDGHNQQLKLIALILLVGFATGQAANILRTVANSIAESIIKTNEGNDRNSNNRNPDHAGDDDRSGGEDVCP